MASTKQAKKEAAYSDRMCKQFVYTDKNGVERSIPEYRASRLCSVCKEPTHDHTCESCRIEKGRTTLDTIINPFEDYL